MLLPSTQQCRAVIVRLVAWLSWMLVAAWPPHAASQNLTVSLSVHALAAQPDGRVLPQPADQVRPGDLLRYEAVYRNAQPAMARGVQATVPIPAGTVYEPTASERLAPLASTDGQRFEATPLHRPVRLPDGRIDRQPVPLSEYRYLRWPLGDLAQGQSATVSAHARVLAAAVPGPAPGIASPAQGPGRRP